MKNSVLLIGVDGASWDFLKPWINDGKLPTLKRLFDSGSTGYLNTTIPPLSCTAWTSLFTGTNPGKHGIFEYLTKSGKLINSRMIKSEKIWNILSQHGKRCCIIDVPLTYPVEEINGYMVSGVLTPPNEKIYSYPPGLMSLLKKHDYQIGVEYEKSAPLIPDQQSVIERRDDLLKELYGVVERKYLTLRELMNECWDFFMFVISETTQVKDLFWDKKEIVLEFYKKIDSYLGDLIMSYSNKNSNPYVFIVSDHGFDAAPTRSFNFRVWLKEEGFIRDERSFFQKIIPKSYRILNLHGILNKPPLSKLLFRFNKVREIKESFQRKVIESPSIYCRKGVFIDKIKLKENEYDKLRDELITKVRQIKDPLTNEGIFQVVEKREAIYSGNNLKYAPDIVLVPKENYSSHFLYDSDKVFDDLKPHLPGRHNSALYGIFLAYGNEIDNVAVKHLSILDIFPTILHILDVPIPKDVDGTALKEIFKKNSYLSNKKIIFSKGEDIVNLEEKNRIKNSLKNIKI